MRVAVFCATERGRILLERLMDLVPQASFLGPELSRISS